MFFVKQNEFYFCIMKIYRIEQSIKLPISREEAWDFLSNPRNLQKLMPKDMGFDILSGADQSVYTGQLIEYNVTPFKGFKTKWVTEITHVQKPDYFVDIQLYGPYKLWHHKHFIKEIKGGVLIEDLVHYRVPFGPLGRLLHPIVIKPKLESIFETRTERMNQLFGTYE